MRTFLAALLACASAPPSAFAQPPKVNDERLKIELVAEAPDIATPIGIDVDDKGRIYVIESHTHFPPKDYKGPKTDRIRVFEDTDGDRKADKTSDFHTGETHTMSLALYRAPGSSEGSLYIATRREVFRLRDTDNDGKADERTSLVKLETKGNYPHNGLSGFAFDFKGDVYFGFGENLGESYKLIGSDKTTLEGGGEGGNIYTCDKDGKKLRRVATGFWNPFHLCFDTFGRLFAVDNDPDGRPPCRLLHIVEGGDYGYRFRYGRGGQHPFTSWNGEIPGTLPMVAGTGEAPSGMLAYESDNLPDDYLGNLLVTSWGDHRIERYRLKPNGASFTSKMEPVITGGENFRPVGIALAPDGSLYVSDWVDKSYNVHGKGRIWRISAKDEKKVERPDPEKEPEKAILSNHRPTRESGLREISKSKQALDKLKDLSFQKAHLSNERLQIGAMQAMSLVSQADSAFLRALITTNNPKSVASMAARLSKLSWDGDFPYPFKRDHLMVWSEIFRNRVADDDSHRIMIEMLSHTDPFVSSALIEGQFKQAPLQREAQRWEWSPRFENDPYDPAQEGNDPALLNRDSKRRNTVVMLRRIGPKENANLKHFLHSNDVDVRFLAIQWIAEEKLTQYRQQLTDSLSRPDTTPRLLVATLTALDMLDGGKPGSVDHVGGRWYLERLVFGEKTAAATRAMALRMLPANNPALTIDAFKKLLASEDVKFRVEVVRTLRDSPHKEKAALLREIVSDEKQTPEVRAEAIAGFDATDAEQLKQLIALAKDKEGVLRDEALRGLRGLILSDEPLETLVPLTGRPKEEATKAWMELLASAKPQAKDGTSGDVEAGGRVFFSAKAGGCFRCHTVGGRGGVAGPDLSTVGKAISRERLLESILQPSKEIAPRFAAQLVETEDGEKRTLMYVGPSPDGTQLWADTNGKEHKIAPGEIESKQPLTTSIMPSGLHQSLTARELRDLLAFLESLK